MPNQNIEKQKENIPKNVSETTIGPEEVAKAIDEMKDSIPPFNLTQEKFSDLLPYANNDQKEDLLFGAVSKKIKEAVLEYNRKRNEN